MQRIGYLFFGLERGEMRQNPKPNEVYHHFKGNDYQIIDIAIHSETRELYVVYKALYGEGKTFIRPLDIFMSEVDHEKYPEITQVYRFEKLDTLIDPGVMEFLEAETIDEKLKILSRMHPRITNDMINTMAVSLDLDVKDGDIEDRYLELQGCMNTLGRFECDRLR